MGIIYCEHCSTVTGHREHTSRATGRTLKPQYICDTARHYRPFQQCDICKIEKPTTTRFHSKGSPSLNWDFEHLTSGRILPSHTPEELAKEEAKLRAMFDRNSTYHDERMAQMRAATTIERLLVCPACAAELRQAQQVAFDQVSAERDGLNAGKGSRK